jgi:hypothetical protein
LLGESLSAVLLVKDNADTQLARRPVGARRTRQKRDADGGTAGRGVIEHRNAVLIFNVADISKLHLRISGFLKQG